MASLPTGTLTILFTDIEGSTRLLQKLGAPEYARVLGEHHRLLRSVIAACDGVEIKTEGDSFFAVFPRATDAITAAVTAQRDLAEVDWPSDAQVSVRMGVHTGDVAISEGEYVGLDIHRAARISAAAHGGQVLLSGTTAALVASALPDGVDVRDVGEHLLRDIEAPEQLHQLDIEGLRTDFPPPHALATRFDLLPAEMSSFIGREAVLGRARELLAGTRLLTLTGPGGTGKTRLAVRLARDVSDEYVDGVAFVALASITDPALVLPTVRHQLGVVEQPGKVALETLAERLAGRDVLFVLDNFEQVAGAAHDVASLLEAATELSIVVTSRIALHITGEQEYPVPPLAVPEVHETVDLERLSRSEAVALFVQRAQAVSPDFALTAANAGAIAAICARLDGLPLAIELAASRVKLLTPAALLGRLQNSLDLLQSTSADRTDRQRTLRGAIDWSYELLEEPEKVLFRRYSAFVGGWRLDDAMAIVESAGPVGRDLLDGTSALLDHSLVRQMETRDEPRFTMLETIREFGREQLAARAELDAIATAHAGHFAALTEEAETHLTAGREWLDRLENDHANVRAALAWLAERDLARALWMGGRLWRFWHLRGHLREGTEILTELLARPADDAPAARAKALVGLAGLVYWQTDFDAARRSYEEALVLARAVGDEVLEVEILYSLAYTRAIESDYEGANRDLASAADLYAGQGNSVMATWASATIGMNMTLSGDHEGALPILESGIKRFAELGEAYGERNASSVLSRALMNLGRVDDAANVNRHVLELALSQQDITSLSAGLHDAASIAVMRGYLELGARLTGAAQRIVDDTGAQPPPTLINRVEALPSLRGHLPAERLDRLITEGRELSMDEAVSLVLASR
jgi:predicted ATPase/class 3 adenylate cyclase